MALHYVSPYVSDRMRCVLVTCMWHSCLELSARGLFERPQPCWLCLWSVFSGVSWSVGYACAEPPLLWLAIGERLCVTADRSLLFRRVVFSHVRM
jgi:hypothetical protein